MLSFKSMLLVTIASFAAFTMAAPLADPNGTHTEVHRRCGTIGECLSGTTGGSKGRRAGGNIGKGLLVGGGKGGGLDRGLGGGNGGGILLRVGARTEHSL